MTHPIRILGDPVLRRRTQPVETFDQALQDLVHDMYETMHEEDGIGLAAPQIGLEQRLLVIGIPMDDESVKLAAFINPEILATRDRCRMEEGCLSIPGIRAQVERPSRIQLKWQDVDGSERKAWFEELEARVLQHEIDHLDGKLFIDYLSPEERSALQPAITRLQEIQGRASR